MRHSLIVQAHAVLLFAKSLFVANQALGLCLQHPLMHLLQVILLVQPLLVLGEVPGLHLLDIGLLPLNLGHNRHRVP